MNKGCYRGQEAVAKVHNLGHPPRRLVFLHLDGSAHALPNTGDEVYLGDEVVGKVTSVGQHFEICKDLKKLLTNDLTGNLKPPAFLITDGFDLSIAFVLMEKQDYS